MASREDLTAPRITEEQFWDFWIKGQQRGFAGKLPRLKLPDGSKMTALFEGSLLYTDRWYGSDSGGGQTLVHVLRWPWNERSPTSIDGTPLARMTYSGQVVDWQEEELKRIIQEAKPAGPVDDSRPNFYHSTPLGSAVSDRCRRLYVRDTGFEKLSVSSAEDLTNPPASEQLWGFLKCALSQTSRTSPFRGPEQFTHPDYPEFEYTSKETSIEPGFHHGTERISYRGLKRFQGTYDFILIRKNLGDQVFGK